MLAALGSRRVLRHASVLARCARRLLGAPAPAPPQVAEDVVIYQGPVMLEHSDPAYDGQLLLVGKGQLHDYVYERLDVPREDGHMPLVGLNVRITVEVLPEVPGWLWT